MSECLHPKESMVGIEYPYGHPGHYDGVSEWRCGVCGMRWGRWSGRVLTVGDWEGMSAQAQQEASK